jgi:acetoin utilization deacetylase AcuC-like enzyme
MPGKFACTPSGMKAFYSDQFELPLPAGHRFPIRKYSLLRLGVKEHGLITPDNLQIPIAADDKQIYSIHQREYWRRVKEGSLSEKEIRRLGFPWSPDLVERSRRSVGGTIAACRSALIDGAAINLSGGTHHAFPDHGGGYCVLNDVAIAARTMQIEMLAHNILILDCDVHQGNGTAWIFSNDPTVFTFSIHSARNYPFHKERSDLDIPLEDGIQDEPYLDALRAGIQIILNRFHPELVIYLAGADPYFDDKLGRLSLTKPGLEERDRLVYETCLRMGLPIATVMAGGYARKVEDTVGIHLQTIRTAVGVMGNHKGVTHAA